LGRSWCRSRSTRSSTPRTRSTRWTCGVRDGKRTWLRELIYDNVDKLILLTSVAILVLITALHIAGYTDLWTPQFLIDLANRRS
jgi:hypothetical protein